MGREIVEWIGGIEFDQQYLPVVVVTYHDRFTGNDFAAMTERLIEVAATLGCMGMLHDTTRLSRVVSAVERKIVREAIDRVGHSLDEKGLSAVIISNPLVRGAMTAAKWFMSTRFEERIFGTTDAGVEWLLARMRVRGVQIPTDVVTALRERTRTAGRVATR